MLLQNLIVEEMKVHRRKINKKLNKKKTYTYDFYLPFIEVTKQPKHFSFHATELAHSAEMLCKAQTGAFDFDDRSSRGSPLKYRPPNQSSKINCNYKTISNCHLLLEFYREIYTLGTYLGTKGTKK